jgi:tetratricopeptide (TPR) repeat protein/lysophospholipase L1-like esterase
MKKKPTRGINEKSRRVKLSRRKRFLYNCILLIVIPFLILFLLEMFLRIFNYGEDYRLFVDFPGKEIQKHKVINPLIGKKYFQKLEHTKPCHDMFLKEKPENSFRIFVMGSSTVLGFPYDENLMFTRILQQRLQDCYPEKQVEVINTAFTAINSFTLLDFIDDVLEEKPDAILVYAGQNEFYGALGLGSVERTFHSRQMTLLHLDLLSFRFYQLLRNMIGRTAERMTGDNKKGDVRGTLMKVIAENREIPYKGKVYNETIRRYEKNMDRILEKARRRHVPVFISELVSNTKDIKPFCSVKTADYTSAEEKYSEGIRLEKEGDFEKAKDCYYQAKDLDCIRFRASEEINEIIHMLAKKQEATLVPMKTGFFEQASPHQLIGNNLMTEHVHPNIDGYFLMADAFFYVLAESKLLGEKLDIVYYKNSTYYKNNWGYTELDSMLGVHRVNSLKYYWPYQPYDAPFVDYREIYKPVSMMDSLALAIIKSPDFKTNEAHLAMARFYQMKKYYYKAYREYHAAILCNPYQVKDYLEAADCLIETDDLPLAMKFIDKSLELQESFYGYVRQGEILIVKGDYPGAIESFTKASKLDEKHENTALILTKLYEAYCYKGDAEQADRTSNELKKIKPDFQPLFPERKMDYVYHVPVQVKDMVNEAIKNFNAGHDDAALEMLMKSLEIKETSLSNRIAGDILMRKNDRNALVYFLRAYPDYKKDINFLSDLGNLYLKYGVTDKAREVLNEMKRLDPGSEKITQLKEKILAAM